MPGLLPIRRRWWRLVVLVTVLGLLVWPVGPYLGVSDAFAAPPPGVLTVHAVDASTGLPVAGATVAATTAAGAPAASGTTDAWGVYAVELRHDAYRIDVSAAGYRPYATTVRVTTGHTTSIEAALAPSATGTAPATDGAPTATPTGTATDTPIPTDTPTPSPTDTAPPPPPTDTATPTGTPTASPAAPQTTSRGRIAFASRSFDYDVLTVNPDGTDPANLTPGTTGGNDHDPAWSPDGRQLVFASDRSGVSYLYVVNADGSGERQLTSGFGHDIQPAWSPDGARIAFISKRAGLSFQLFVIGADGANITQLTDLPTIQQEPSWSPDSREIVFVCGSALCILNADGSGLRTWFGSSLSAGTPDWSPEGRRIAFSYDGAVWLRNVDGSGGQRLVDGEQPTWSPDGTQLALVRRDAVGGYPHVWRIGADGSGLTRVTGGTSYDLAPDW